MSRGPSGATTIWAWDPNNGFNTTPAIWGRIQNFETAQAGNSLVDAWPNGTPTRTTLPAGSSWDGVGRAARFEVRSGDVSASGERSEVSGDGMSWQLKEGDERWLQFRIKFATNWTPGTQGRWNMFAQLHAGTGSPPMSFQVDDNGNMIIDDGGLSRDTHTARTGGALKTIFMPGSEWYAKRGQWIDVNIHWKNSVSYDVGWAEVHVDGVLRAAKHKRQTASSNRTYLKMGNYRFPQSQTNVLWIDDVRLSSGTQVGGSEADPGTGGTAGAVTFIDGATQVYETDQTTGPVTSFALPRPTSGGALVAGDLLVGQISWDAPNATAVTRTLPAGWTSLFGSPLVVGTAPSIVQTEVFYHVVTSAEVASPPTSWTVTTTSAWDGGVAVSRFRGVDSTDPFAVASGNYATSITLAATTKTSPSVTTDVPNAMVLIGTAIRSGLSTLTSLTGDYTQGPGTWGLAGRVAAMAYKVQASAGATPNATWTHTSGVSGVGWSTALRPAVVQAPPTSTAPTVEAGANASVTAGGTFTRTMSENSGGSPITARSWTIVSSPDGTATGVLGTTSTLTWQPTEAQVGTYVIRASATNVNGTGTDDFTLRVDPVGTATIQHVQSFKGQQTWSEVPTNTSMSRSLPAPATAGNFLVAAWAVNGDAGTFTPPAGWTVMAQREVTGVALLICYKKAVGGEQAVSASWTLASEAASCVLAEYSGVHPDNPLGPNNFPPFVDQPLNNITLDPTAAVVNGAALAFIATASTGGAGGFEPSATGWTLAQSAYFNGNISSPGMALLHDLSVASGEDISANFSWTRNTERIGFITLLNAGGASIPDVELPPEDPDALTWLPPAGFENFTLKTPTSTTALNTIDGAGGDVRIVLPSTPIAPIVIQNCRHAVLIGGQINMLGVETLGSEDQRGVYIRTTTGTVHIEGLLIVGHASGFGDGFAMNAPNALLQIQRCRVQDMRGSTGNHGDVFQPWGGAREFRIDRLTGSSDYQGLHIGEDLGAIGRGTIKNTNIYGQAVSSAGGGHLIWTNPDAYELTLENVYIKPRPGRSFGSSVWPQSSDSSFPANITNGFATWPSTGSLITGGVREGDPPGGDFSPAAAVGIGYVSPYSPPEVPEEPPPPVGASPTLRSRQVGFPETGMGRVAANVGSAVRCRLKVGTDPAVTSGVTYGPYVTPNAQGDVRMTVGLPTSRTSGKFYYRVAMVNSQGGEWLDTASQVGILRTAPTGRVGLTFSFGSCLNATDSASATAIFNRGDEVCAIQGDFWYADGTGTGVANYRSKMDAKLRAPNVGRMIATIPFIYTPSDHDYGMVDDGIGSGTGGDSFNTVYREKISSPDLPGSRGVYWTRPWGTAIRFIVLDTRSFGVIGSTKLGSTQKAWLKTTITEATEDLLIIVQDGVWIGGTDAGSDDWQGTISERNEIGDYIAASGKNVVMIGGDMHAVAADNGTNSRGGFPVYMAAPMNNTSSVKGGPYSAGTYPTAAGSSVQQYGRIVVSLSDTTITSQFTGYSSDNTVRKTMTNTFAADPPPPEEAGRAVEVWDGSSLASRLTERWNGSALVPMVVE